MVPTAVDGSSGSLTAVYTSVSGSPVHYTLPYKRGCETQSIAQSTDGGRTWVKSKKNPILAEPPAHLQPCGWRDPYLAAWKSMDKALGLEEGTHLYGMISGGLAGQSPTLFLYAVPRNQLDNWQFISPLINLGLNHQLSRWSGDMGQNLEAGTFMTLSDHEGTSRDFIVAGTEGCKTDEAQTTRGPPQRSTEISRAARSQQWMSGDLVVSETRGSKTVEMKYRIGGRLDHGCLYGVNTFWDPVKSQQIAWGWIREEDLPQHLVDRQNWSGLMSLPRELRLLTLRNVTGSISSPLESITSIELSPSSTHPGSHTLRTLGISPATTLKRLRTTAREVSIPSKSAIPNLKSLSSNSTSCNLDVQTCRFELTASISIPQNFIASSSKSINISISHSPTHDLLTTLSFHPSSETLTLYRPDSSSVDPAINSHPETAPHTLFKFSNPNAPEEPTIESYDVKMWLDESVLEVFVNGRTVISTRIYPGRKRIWGAHFWIGDPSHFGQHMNGNEDVKMKENDDDEEEEEEDAGSVKSDKKEDIMADDDDDDDVNIRDDDDLERQVKGKVILTEARAWDGLRADSKIV
ncbi:putative glycosyl hydrolase family protein [Phaeomoniella chlamydospora]|uniref:Putative glycosyl hydrolase family protein n=1 Tax=Phaeomoniella chlamydospora TaxID=158046 RepID=A0A0G2EH09_PHACM|nr:putative glycosyl hydrolase family protein [Phaeomoniella chlamydospora]